MASQIGLREDDLDAELARHRLDPGADGGEARVVREIGEIDVEAAHEDQALDRPAMPPERVERIHAAGEEHRRPAGGSALDRAAWNNRGVIYRDLKDLKDIQPFVLTTDTISKYYVRYLGKEKLDDLECYAFAVKPKEMEKGERYFAGIVWVDSQDLQVVRTYGRGVGVQSKNQAFPKFETTRQQIDGKYWFPVYTIADDTLYFQDSSQRIRQVVKYEDYKQFKSDVKITFGDQVDQAAPPKDPKKP